MIRRRAAEVGLAVMALLMVGIDLGTRVLANNDEARFPLLAQDILTRGDWWWPRLGDTVYHNKPPFFAWLIALVSWPLGHVTPLTAALPSALAGVAMVWLVYEAGRDLFGTDAGRYGSLVLLTMQGFVLHARVPMPDMLFACCVAGSLRALWPMTRGRDGWWAAFYAFVAAAVWSKGLAGLLPLALAAAWTVVGRDAQSWRRLRPWPGLLLLAVLLAPLALRALGSEGSAMRHAVVSDQFAWFVPRAPALSALVLPLENTVTVLFPWVLVLPIALWHAGRAARGRGVERDGVVLLLAWSAGTLIAVALSHQQRVRYYVPLAPPVALLIGWWTSGVVVRHRQIAAIPWRVYGAGAAAAVVLVGVVAAAAAARSRLPRDLAIAFPGSAFEAVVTVGTLAIVVAALGVGVSRGRLRGAFTAAWIASAVLLLSGYHWQVTRRNGANDYAGLAARVAGDLAQVSTIAAWGVPDLPLAYYLRRPVVVVSARSDVAGFVDRHPDSVMFLAEASLNGLPESAHAATLVTDRLAFRPVVVARINGSAGPGR